MLHIDKRIVLLSLFGFLVCCLVVWLIYQPGVSGDPIFDDMLILAPLERTPITDFQSFVSYLFTSEYLPGRILSYAAFAVDIQSWPASAESLKTTNIIIHCINIGLALLLSYTLFRLKFSQRDAVVGSLVVAALWAVHPIHVSAVSYIVQRMTLLSASFALLSLIVVLRAYIRCLKLGFSGIRYLQLWLGMGIGYVGVFAKETSFLVCGFALLLIWFVNHQLRPNVESVKDNGAFRLFKWITIYMPIALFSIYLIFYSGVFSGAYSIREYSPVERLMSQPRAVWAYLFELVYPSTPGSVFYNSFAVSRGLFEPLSTVFSIIGIGALIGLSVSTRVNLYLRFGIAFFLIGHALESTILNLELYYEHRNYLPSLGLIFGLIGALFSVTKTKTVALVASVAAAIVLIGVLSLETHKRANVWGDPDRFASTWYQFDPDSLRASSFYASRAFLGQQYGEVNRVNRHALTAHPEHLLPYLQNVFYGCVLMKSVSKDIIESAIDVASKSPHDFYTIKLAGDLLNGEVVRGCINFNDTAVLAVINQLLENSNFSDERSQAYLYQILANYAYSQRKFADYIGHLNHACEKFCTAEIYTQQVSAFLSAGFCEKAVEVAKRGLAEQSYRDRFHYYKEIASLKRAADHQCK